MVFTLIKTPLGRWDRVSRPPAHKKGTNTWERPQWVQWEDWFHLSTVRVEEFGLERSSILRPSSHMSQCPWERHSTTSWSWWSARCEREAAVKDNYKTFLCFTVRWHSVLHRSPYQNAVKFPRDKARIIWHCVSVWTRHQADRWC